MAFLEKMKGILNSQTGILGIAALVTACSGVAAWDMMASAETIDSADTAATEISLGDLNGDSEVNASDAAMVLVAAASVGAGDESGLTAEQELAADLNGDSAFNAVDAALILTYAAYRGSGGTAELDAFLSGEYENVESTTATETTTQAPVDESDSITREGYYGQPWDFWNGNTAYCWVTSSRIVRYDFNTNTLAYDYELSGQEYTDFMYVYNNEISCGSYPASTVSTAFKYINNLKTLGRDRVLYTNDIEDDGICSSVWSVWITSDGEYWWTA